MARKSVESEHIMTQGLSSFKHLHLAIHYHTEAHVENGRIHYPGYFGKWIDSLAPYFREVTVITHSAQSIVNSDEIVDYVIKSPNVSVCDLGPRRSLKYRVLHRRKYAKIVSEQASQWDLVGLRVPTPLAIYLYPIVRRSPVFFLLVGNIVNALRMRVGSLSAWKKWVLTKYWQYDHWQLSRQARSRLVFAIGPYFRVEYQGIENMVILHTSSISEADISARKDCCNAPKIRMVYVGYLRAHKGLDTAITATRILLDRGVDCQFRIIGPKKGVIYRQLCDLVRERSLNNVVEFAGWINHGPDLYAILDESDVMLLPSHWDWQTRALFEGMARGLPIVASRGIKSLPMMFRHKEDIYFVDPDSPEQIADAVMDIRSDRVLRTRLINNALQIASTKTLEKSAELLLQGLNRFYGNGEALSLNPHELEDGSQCVE